MDTYYNSYYQLNDEKITFDDPKKFGRYLFDLTCEDLTRKGTLSILDYGGGIGTISIELAKRYLNYGVSEVRVTIVDYERNAFIDSVPNLVVDNCSALSEVNDQKFDIVIASAIVEHLPEPRTEIICLFELLQEYGLIYFRTPYVTPIMLLGKRLGINIDFTYPGHLHDLGQEFWDNILGTFDLKNEYKIIYSKPSIVETTFFQHFKRTLVAYICKAPWYVLGNRWRFVGGWEILIQKAIPSTPVENSGRGS